MTRIHPAVVATRVPHAQTKTSVRLMSFKIFKPPGECETAPRDDCRERTGNARLTARIAQKSRSAGSEYSEKRPSSKT